MYFDMLKVIISPEDRYRIYLDIKDTLGATKVAKLHDVLSNNMYDFSRTIVDSRPIFRGQILALKRHPVIQNKEATFWHLLSEGKIEENRLPDLRRCERIRWPRPIIERESDSRIKIWENKRRQETLYMSMA